MKAYVITIESNDKSVQVADRCIKSAKWFGVNVEQWRATTPKDNPIAKLLEDDVKISGLHEAYSRIANCAAAFHSHYSLWKHCIELDEQIMILEHDAIFVNQLPQNLKFNKCISLGHPSYGRWNEATKLGVSPLFSKRYFPGAHGYIVKPEACREFVKRATEVMARPTDVFLNIESFPWLEEYYPWPVKANDSFTTIQNESGCYAKHNYGETYGIEKVR